MLLLLSPAKTLDFEHEIPACEGSNPVFGMEADLLARKLAAFSPKKLQKLMSISPKLADLNALRFANWQSNPVRACLFAYAGDAYQGLKASTLNEASLQFAQQHLIILSGMYGALRPFDLIKPYRLEMSTPLSLPRNKDLYGFWQKKITPYLNQRLTGDPKPVLVNLASQEYSSVIAWKQVRSRVITPVFKDKFQGGYKVLSLFAKKARGMMCRYVFENQMEEYEMLIGFDSEGYHFNHGLSGKDTWVFTRN